MPTLNTSGTLTPDGTEQTLATVTSVGTFQLFIDLNGMANGDRVRIRTYYKVLTGGTERLLEGGENVYEHAQGHPIKRLLAEQSDISIKWTFQRDSGSFSSVPWKVLAV